MVTCLDDPFPENRATPPCCGMAVLQALRAGHPGEKLKREWWLFFSATAATHDLMIATCSQSRPAD